jgi:uncharacterized protein (TIGR00725 family)
MPFFMKKIQHIAIFGGAEAKEESAVYQQVFAVSQKLAENKYTIVNGGGPGVMMAATKGAEAGQGETLCVTFEPKNAPGFEGRYIQNITDQEIKTKNYIERMFKLMEHGDCYIIFNGGTGTISEFGTAWCLARLYYGHHKPFILFGDFWHDILNSFYRNMMMRESDDKVYRVVNSVEGVLAAIREFDLELEGLENVSRSLEELGDERAFMR